MDVVGIGTPYYDMVINVSKMPGLDGAAGANEAFYQGGGKVATRQWPLPPDWGEAQA